MSYYVNYYLLLETGDYLLLEDGGKIIIGEYVIYLVKGKDIRHIDLAEVEKNILS